MKTMIFRIRSAGYEQLDDDSLIKDMMNRLLEEHPQLTGYQWERCDGYINILVWGEIEE